MTQNARDPRFAERVTSSFNRQAAMTTLGAKLLRVGLGEVDIELPFRQDLTQQHGFLHAGIVSSVMDSACGLAALAMAEPGTAVLSIEFKINLLAPARGDRFLARARVVRAGRTVTVATADFEVVEPARRESRSTGAADVADVVATMTATIMTLRDRPGLND